MTTSETTTVLLVEDKEQVRSVLSEILHDLRLEVLEADSGPRALDVARAHDGPIHVLLSDVVMPGMEGPELAKELRKLHPEARVVFMSGYANQSVDDALDVGDAFLRKPFQLDQLRTVLADLAPEA